MKTNSIIIAITTLAIISSCSSTKVVTDADKSVDFTKYKTYELKRYEGEDGSMSIIINEMNEKRIYHSIERQLTSHGVEHSSEPDVYVVYGIDLDLVRGYSTSTSYTGGPNYAYGRRGRVYYGGGFGSSHSTTVETQTTNGKLAVGLIDAENDEQIWISEGTKEISQNRKNVEENIKKSVDKIFKDFPINKQHEPSDNPDLISKAK